MVGLTGPGGNCCTMDDKHSGDHPHLFIPLKKQSVSAFWSVVQPDIAKM